MNNSNRCHSGGKVRPKKPRPDYPLYPHKGGSWAKKVLGKTVYFSKWQDDPKGVAALEMWLEQKDDLLAGREPRSKTDGLILADLCNEFLSFKQEARDNGELNPRTFLEYYDTCGCLVKGLTRDRRVADLAPDDFRKLRAALAKTRGPVALRNVMQRCRSIFKFGFDQGLIITPVRFGQSFAKPKMDAIRRAREAHRAEHGDRMFEAAEIRQILNAAKQPLKAMILLAANGGFGQSDLAALPLRTVNLDTGWLDFARVKTGIRRRVPLWPETISAIQEWLPLRPKAKDKSDAGLLFLTCRGSRWVKTNPTNGSSRDALGQEFQKVIRRLGLKRSRVGFYALRHTFETIASATTDQIAVDAIMGHIDSSMSGLYRERIDDDRLQKVVDHVRQWLFDTPDDDSTTERPTSKAKPTAKKLSTDSDTDTGIRLFIG